MTWKRSVSVTSVSYEELRKQYLQFSVYDFDRFSRNDLIGQVALKELLDCTDLEQEIEYAMDILCAMQVSTLTLNCVSIFGDTIDIIYRQRLRFRNNVVFIITHFIAIV